MFFPKQLFTHVILKCYALLFQTPAEISLMRYTNYISSLAHVDVMRKARPGMMEYQLESLFMHHTYYYGGCRFMSYTCICACGPNGEYYLMTTLRPYFINTVNILRNPSHHLLLASQNPSLRTRGATKLSTSTPK